MLENQNREEISKIGNKANSFNEGSAKPLRRDFQGLKNLNYKGFSDSQRRLINRLVREPAGVNLPSVLRKGAAHKDYIKLSRFLTKLTTAGLLIETRPDGLRTFTATKDLLLLSADLNKTSRLDVKPESTKVGLISAIAKLHAVVKPFTLVKKRRNWFWIDSQFLLNYKHITGNGWKILNNNFDTYKEEVEDKYLIYKKEDSDIYKAIPYNHRFLEQEIKKKIVEYNTVWNSAKHYISAVHLTCTFDDSRTLGEINADLCKKFNKLMRWIQCKTKKKKIPYLKVLEFQDNGKHHLHVILFGLRRIADKKTEISPYLEKIGFGKICFVYQLVNRNGWRWSKHKPEEAKTYDPQSHFKKYLEKSLEEHSKTAAYWLFNKRFFSNSLSLLQHGATPEQAHSGGWVFIGCFKLAEIPDFVFQQLDFSKSEIT